MIHARASVTAFAIAVFVAACGSGTGTPSPQSGGGGSSVVKGGAGGNASGGAAGNATGGAAGGSSGGAAGNATGGTAGNATGGAAGSATGGSTAGGGTAGKATGGTAGGGTGGSAGSDTGGTAGKATGGVAGSATGGAAGSGTGGTAGSATGGAAGKATGGTAGGTGGTTDGYVKPSSPPADEDGSQLWLRYVKVSLASRLAEYQAGLTQVVKAGSSDTLQAAQAELVKGLSGLLGTTIATSDQPTADGAVVLGTPASSSIVKSLSLPNLAAAGTDGYVVQSADLGGKQGIVVAANSDVGVLRGCFALLRHLQCHRPLAGLALASAPKIQRRILDHWDNLDGTIERGYAGKSLWSWSSLPGTISQRYKDYARANASLGINGVVLNNVNADAQILTSSYLDKVAALATAFRPYGITVYLSAQYGAPIKIGSLSTADPTNSSVKSWWATLADTIYQKIPDFGGFLVKANSEGQSGPADYGKTHADGANLLAAALAPHNGIVMWRAFVYKDDGSDRIGQAYKEFHPLDGKFASNAMVQVKNGPLDFQPREPFHPLFGGMASTPVALELQVTKEYLGEDTHLAYLGPLYEEVLKSDTYAKGQGSTVARVIDGTTFGYAITAMAGVANVGSDTNWTGSHFNQANWYVYGRMAWDPDVTAADVADEWIRQTFSNDPTVVDPVKSLMMSSRQNLVNYMTPLGLAHIMGTDDHYGPGPWINNLSTANWNPFYYHKADATGIGFDRTSTGSNSVSQYFATVRDKLASKTTVPDDNLLFFQRMGWDDKLASSGRSIWEELVYRYSTGVDSVQTMRDTWGKVQGYVDTKRFGDVNGFLQTQHYEARWWRDACLTYFASVSKHTISSSYAAPAHDLAYYQSLETKCPSDATKPRCSDIYSGTPSPAVLK